MLRSHDIAENLPAESVRTRWWIATSAAVGCVALCKTLQPPVRWAATQAQVDYRFGLVKRGLFGAVFTRPLHLQHFERFALFSFALLGILLALIVWFVVRSGLMQRVRTFEVGALFFSSYAITYLAELNGYFDIPLAIIAVALLLIRNPVRRLLWSLPWVAVALMTHELFLIIFLPVVLLSFLLQSVAAEGETLTKGLKKAGVLGLFAVAVTLAMALRPSLTAVQAEMLQGQIQQSVDFDLDDRFFPVMTRSFGDNLREMKVYETSAGWWKYHVISLFIIFPTVLLLLLLTRQVLRSAGVDTRGWIGYCTVAAALSPLLMNLLGCDAGRWASLTILTSFLVLLSACYYTQGAGVALSPGFRQAVLLVTMLNMASGGMLFGGDDVRSFPFLPAGHVSLKPLLPSHWKPANADLNLR